MNRAGVENCRSAIPVFLALCLTAACSRTMTTEPYSIDGRPVKLTILHTTDTHSKVFPFVFDPQEVGTDRILGLFQKEDGPFGGAARLASLLRVERERSDRLLYLDSGDLFQGAPVFNLFRGEVEYRAAQLNRVDALAIGNHEFDFGADNLVEQMRRVVDNPPLLAANYLFEDPAQAYANDMALLARPYVILNRRGLSIAVIGMGNFESLTNINMPDNSAGIRSVDAAEVLNEIIGQVRHRVDLVVLNSHLGLDVDQQVAIAVPGIDVIVGGHHHVYTDPPTRIPGPPLPGETDGREVVLLHSAVDMKYLSRLDLWVQQRRVIASEFRVFGVCRFCRPADHPAVRCECPDWVEVECEIARRAVIEVADSLRRDECRIDLDDCGEWQAQLEGLPAECRQAVGQRIDGETARVRPAYDEGCETGTGSSSGDGCSLDDVLALRQMRYLPEEPAMVTALAPYRQALDLAQDLTRVVGASQDVFERNMDDGGDSPLGNLVCLALRQKDRIAVDFAVYNALGIRAVLPRGPLTMQKMYEIFPFENSLVTAFMTGLELKETWDFVARKSASRGCRTQMHVSGARIELDCSTDTPTGEPMTRHLRVGSQVIVEEYELKKPYAIVSMAMNNYIGDGGSGFDMLQRNTTKLDTGISLRDLFIDYLQGHSPVSVSDVWCPENAGEASRNEDGLEPGAECSATGQCRTGLVCFDSFCRAPCMPDDVWDDPSTPENRYPHLIMRQ